MTTIYKFKAGYTKLGVATAPSSAPTITVVDSSNNIVVAGTSLPSSLSNLTGAYLYSYSGSNGLNLVGLFHTTDATMDAQDLFAIPDLSTYFNALGAGSTSTPITIDDGVNPLDGVDVWATTDSGGTNVVARGSTNASGLVTFLLDAGTYYIWKTLAGYTFSNPSTLVVT